MTTWRGSDRQACELRKGKVLGMNFLIFIMRRLFLHIFFGNPFSVRSDAGCKQLFTPEIIYWKVKT
jgi:hypothetical protein